MTAAGIHSIAWVIQCSFHQNVLGIESLIPGTITDIYMRLHATGGRSRRKSVGYEQKLWYDNQSHDYNFEDIYWQKFFIYFPGCIVERKVTNFSFVLTYLIKSFQQWRCLSCCAYLIFEMACLPPMTLLLRSCGNHDALGVVCWWIVGWCSNFLCSREVAAALTPSPRRRRRWCSGDRCFDVSGVGRGLSGAWVYSRYDTK